MLTIIPDSPKTIIYKRFAEGLQEAFVAKGIYHVLTFSAALVASNVVNGTVGVTALTATTYATSSDATLAALATKIAAVPGVKKVEIVENTGTTADDRILHVYPEDQAQGISLTGFAVTAGASQATIAVTTVDARIKTGMPVEIDSTDGEVKPVTAASHDLNCIGMALKDADAGEMVAIQARGTAIIFVQANGAIVAGAPVKYSGYDTATGYNKASSDTVAVASQWGWAIEAAADGATLRILVKG